MAIQYIDAMPGSANWLTVQLDTGPQVSLPYGLMVEFNGRQLGRDHFTVLEGVNKGQHASVAQRSAASSYLVKNVHHLPAGTIRFDSKTQHLFIGTRGPFNAFSGGGPGRENGQAVNYTPVPPGTYLLVIPTYPSAQTRPQYSQWAKFHKTWFRIGLSPTGSRFLHVGEISDGCVTVRPFLYDGRPTSRLPDGFGDLSAAAQSQYKGLIGLPLAQPAAPTVSFDEVYRYLILRRLNDQAVAKLIVTNNGKF